MNIDELRKLAKYTLDKDTQISLTKGELNNALAQVCEKCAFILGLLGGLGIGFGMGVMAVHAGLVH